MEKRTKMKPALEKMRKAGHELAKAEYEYKKALRKEVLLERAKETAVGVIDKIVYGEDIVGMLRLKRDIALTDYETYKELVMLLKSDLRLLDNQIAREWGNSD
jgi:hypothetical protein